MKLLKDLGIIKPKPTSKYTTRMGVYKCPLCGKPFIAMTGNVNSGKTYRCKSCASIARNTTHGKSKTKNYSRWLNMKDRCYNPNNKHYVDYGARDIKVCSEWQVNFEAFERHILSLPNAEAKGYSLDRVDNDSGYGPGNMRWATATEQVLNQRSQKNNTSGVQGVYFVNNKWIAKIGVDKKSIYLGTFETKGEAKMKREEAEIKYRSTSC